MLGKRKFPFSRAKNCNGISGERFLTESAVNIQDLLSIAVQKIPAKALEIYPSIIFVHQLYNQGQSRTWVDQQINILKNEGKVTTFKLQVEDDDLSLAVAFTSDLAAYINRVSSSRDVSRFVEDILPHIRDVCVEKSVLKNQFKTSDSGLRELIHAGVLVTRDIDRFWISFPGAGEFVKAYTLGRKHLLRTLRNAKYSEILEAELLKRSVPKKAWLGIDYHVLDLIGAEDLKCIDTTSGKLLRIIPD